MSNRRGGQSSWFERHVNDPYVKASKKEGYRSRAAYKLLEIQKKDHILKPGHCVIDLGAAPGSWSQVAHQLVGSKGKVLAIDLLVMDPIPGVWTHQGDFLDDNTFNAIETELGTHEADVVLSDMAPNLCGHRDTDQARAYALAEAALHFALTHLKADGSFLIKIFHGAGFEEFLKDVRQAFTRVCIRKPEASRDRSSEVYVLAQRRLIV